MSVPMTRDEIRPRREALGLSRAAFARLVGVPWSTVWRWEEGYSVPRGPYLDRAESVLTEQEDKRRRQPAST